MKGPRSLAFALVLAVALGAGAALGQVPYRPSPEELRASYIQADELARARSAAYKLRIDPHWFGGRYFWYLNALPGGAKEFVLVDCDRGQKRPAFDHARLAEGLARTSGKMVEAAKLPFSAIEFDAKLSSLTFDWEGKRWSVDLSSYVCRSLGAAPQRPEAPQRKRTNLSPDGNWVFEIAEGKLSVRSKDGGDPVFVSSTDSVHSGSWAPDSRRIVAFRGLPGDRRQVYLIRSSPAGGGRAQLVTRDYDLPGDKLDLYEVFVFDRESKSEHKVDVEPILGGGRPWANPPGVDWWRDGSGFMLDYVERGYQRYRVEWIDLATLKSRTLIDERSDTFVDTTSIMLNRLSKAPELLWRSERDGWGHLYLVDGLTGAVKSQITQGPWVVRSVEWMDEDRRQVCFSACGMDADRDPYYIHYFVVGLDGRGMRRLTDGHGTHRAQFSPDRKYFVDTYSRVDAPPVHELRRLSDGKLVVELERADLADWSKFKIPFPEPFAAKGRDGKTDIWGVVYRPTNFEPGRRYPVIENLYAGPHDSHVPKAFSPLPGSQQMAELGFIVVQIDGMGTRNRGKAFHDVCWKNIADAGFPDRILWMKALAAKYAYIDLERVGVYGSSAGGQSSTGALLFHPEFYKVAVSSCGCHDNRMDKYWWNEQWMGYPVGPHYEAQSNITNAVKLQGRLLLMVGELDTNVPPESTFRLVDALIRARKEFEFVMLPGMDHTGGGAYGERKRRDFFVRWLHGVEPPNWNQTAR